MTTTMTGDAELRRKLAKLKDLRSLAPYVEAEALRISGLMRTDVPQPSRAKMEFVSDKQRRYFFWALKEGIIEVPYRRGASPGSEKLEQSWTISGMDGGLKQIIGNDTTYGPLVQGPLQQTAYHKNTGWITTDEVVNEQNATTLNAIKKGVDKILASG